MSEYMGALGVSIVHELLYISETSLMLKQGISPKASAAERFTLANILATDGIYLQRWCSTKSS